MASRIERRATARAARKVKQRELEATAARRRRLKRLAAAVIVTLAALAIAIRAGSGGSSNFHLGHDAQASALEKVESELAGLRQSYSAQGDVLGDPKAPVTITEYGDLVCPICYQFATTTEPEVISNLIKSGKAKLVFRGFETASAHANGEQYVNTQVAARAAGLQHRGWTYILLMYQEQPQLIDGEDAELVPYINMAYLQHIAQQIKGLDVRAWQAHMTDPVLSREVAADGRAALASGATGTPAIFVSGPKGTLQYDKSDTLSAIPSAAQVEDLVNQVR